MSTQITEALRQEYDSMIEVGLQQKGPRLRFAVRNETGGGKHMFFDRVEATTATKRTTRHSDTPRSDTPHTRRRVSMDDYEDADLIDHQDLLRISGNPQSPYVMTRIHALGRAIDDEIITQAFGTAFEGETGATSTVLPAGQKIVDGGTNLTIDKLRTARKTLDLNEAIDGEPTFAAVSPDQIESLLETTEVTSSDFNTVKALVSGEVNTFMGFQFIMTNRLPKTGNIRQCLFWARSGILLAMGADIETRITEESTKSFSIQVYAKATFGATRMYEEKIVQVDCDETA